jgi:hypothetical protein
VERDDLGPRSYASGERVFGPPAGVFDVEWVARAVERECGVPFGLAHGAVTTAWNAALAAGTVNAAPLERAIVDSGQPPLLGHCVALAVEAYCRSYEVDLAER